MTAPQSLASTTIDTWKEVIHGNLDAAFYLSRAVLPYLHESDRGALVHIASGLGAWARPNFGAYGPAKAGIILLTRQLALENAHQLQWHRKDEHQQFFDECRLYTQFLQRKYLL